MTTQISVALFAMMTLIVFCLGVINILIARKLIERRKYITAFFSIAVGAAQLALLVAFMLARPVLTLEQKFMAEIVSVTAGIAMFAITMVVLEIVAG